MVIYLGKDWLIKDINKDYLDTVSVLVLPGI